MLNYFEEKSERFKSSNLFFYEKFLWEVKKSERSLEQKNGEAKARKELNVKLFIVE